MIYHKHLLVNAKVKNPIATEQEGIDFLTNLVNKIDMKIIKGPFASYVDKDGNKGLTAIVMIETSHIAFHIWDEVDPGHLQLDLYTCGRLELDLVLSIIKDTFNIVEMDFMLFDRENGFKWEVEGREADGVTWKKYNNGKEPGILDPNIGGYIGDKAKKELDALWASQQSFEE